MTFGPMPVPAAGPTHDRGRAGSIYQSSFPVGELAEWLDDVRLANSALARSKFRTTTTGRAVCEHSVAGGHIPEPGTGWVPCPQERRRIGWTPGGGYRPARLLGREANWNGTL